MVPHEHVLTRRQGLHASCESLVAGEPGRAHTERSTEKDVVWSGAKLVGENTEATLVQGKAKAPMNEYSNPSDTLTIFAIFTGISRIQRAY